MKFSKLHGMSNVLSNAGPGDVALTCHVVCAAHLRQSLQPCYPSSMLGRAVMASPSFHWPSAHHRNGWSSPGLHERHHGRKVADACLQPPCFARAHVSATPKLPCRARYPSGRQGSSSLRIASLDEATLGRRPCELWSKLLA